MKTEFAKLTTVRAPWLLIAGQLLLTCLAVAGSIAAGIEDDRMVLAHGGVPALFALVLGIGAYAGEGRHRTLTDTFLSTPARARVIAAKLATYTLIGLVIGLASAALTAAVGATTADLGDTANQRMLAGIVVWNALYAAIGVGLGAVVGNLTGAIVIALAWIALVEQALSRLITDVAAWLPVASAQALANMPGTDLSQWEGGLVLAGYATVLGVAAVIAVARRDVT